MQISFYNILYLILHFYFLSSERDRNQQDGVNVKPTKTCYSYRSRIFSTVLLILCISFQSVNSSKNVVDETAFKSGSLGYKLRDNWYVTSKSSVEGDVNANVIDDFAIDLKIQDALKGDNTWRGDNVANGKILEVQDPTGKPSSFPSAQPSSLPSSQPSSVPFSQPSSTPTVQPSTAPTSQPSTHRHQSSNWVL